jgi:acetyltransferase-like isoleucine patch superfamily enzyme
MKAPDREVIVRLPDGEQLRCGTTKFAGILGDGAHIGMGALIGPGILIGRATILYPGVVLSSRLIPEETVVKFTQTRIEIERRRRAAKHATTD